MVKALAEIDTHIIKFTKDFAVELANETPLLTCLKSITPDEIRAAYHLADFNKMDLGSIQLKALQEKFREKPPREEQIEIAQRLMEKVTLYYPPPNRSTSDGWNLSVHAKLETVQAALPLSDERGDWVLTRDGEVREVKGLKSRSASFGDIYNLRARIMIATHASQTTKLSELVKKMKTLDFKQYSDLSLQESR